jgi:hypothetical protein
MFAMVHRLVFIVVILLVAGCVQFNYDHPYETRKVVVNNGREIKSEAYRTTDPGVLLVKSCIGDICRSWEMNRLYLIHRGEHYQMDKGELVTVHRSHVWGNYPKVLEVGQLYLLHYRDVWHLRGVKMTEEITMSARAHWNEFNQLLVEIVVVNNNSRGERRESEYTCIWESLEHFFPLRCDGDTNMVSYSE